jgi:hypothetical protein
MHASSRVQVVVLLLLVASACRQVDGPAAPPTTGTRLRVVHVSPSAPALDIAIDNITVLRNLNYSRASDYATVPPGPHELEVRVAGSTATIGVGTIVFTADDPHTFVAAGDYNLVGGIVVTDSGARPDPGKTRIRVINGARGAPDVDILLTQPDFATEFVLYFPSPFGSLSTYHQSTAGNYRVRIRRQSDKVILADTGPISVPADQVRTVMLMDKPGGGVQTKVYSDRP